MVTAALLLPTAACDAPQSALHPAGAGAERIAGLFWWMAAGALLIWAAVIGIAIHATRLHPARHSVRTVRWLIIGGGVIFPTVVLAGLLIYSLPLLPQLRAPADADVRVEVSGYQWWWRVRYLPEGGEPVELANEIRLPVGQRVEFSLTTADVIHSFWIPSLGGKMDMIPGRVNRLVLEPTEPGVYYGACAEFCGTSHALMKFVAVAMEPAAFAQWLEHQASPARPPASALAERGQQAFLANGCGSCHTIRGTPAAGEVGPDLTHVGSRLTLGAGIMPNEPDAFVRWIGHTGDVKPDVKMPTFGVLPAAELKAIAAYLSELQ
jgi:cytochrome c oxidase subunit 2